jgi:hypothetical protein
MTTDDADARTKLIPGGPIEASRDGERFNYFRREHSAVFTRRPH